MQAILDAAVQIGSQFQMRCLPLGRRWHAGLHLADLAIENLSGADIHLYAAVTNQYLSRGIFKCRPAWLIGKFKFMQPEIQTQRAGVLRRAGAQRTLILKNPFIDGASNNRGFQPVGQVGSKVSTRRGQVLAGKRGITLTQTDSQIHIAELI